MICGARALLSLVVSSMMSSAVSRWDLRMVMSYSLAESRVLEIGVLVEAHDLKALRGEVGVKAGELEAGPVDDGGGDELFVKVRGGVEDLKPHLLGKKLQWHSVLRFHRSTPRKLFPALPSPLRRRRQGRRHKSAPLILYNFRRFGKGFEERKNIIPCKNFSCFLGKHLLLYIGYGFRCQISLQGGATDGKV